MSNEHKNTEEVRRLLQEKLASKEPAEDGWNVPSGGVWSGISEELGANRKAVKSSNKSLWYLVGIGAILAVLLIRECSHRQEVEQMRQEIQQVRQECEEKQSSRKDNSPESRDAAAMLAMGASPVGLPDDKLTNQQISTLQQQVPILKSSFPEPIQSFNSAGPSSETTSKFAFSQAEPTTYTTEQYLDANIGFGQTSTGELTPVPTLALSILTTDSKLPSRNIHLPKPEGKALPLAIIGSLQAGLALTGNRLSGEKPTIISNQQPLTTWRAGIGLEGIINRHWSVLSGVEYTHSRIETEYQLQVPFTHNGEYQHDDGNFDNQYNHSLPSALGNYPAQFVLTRASDATIHEGDLMDLELHIRQQTRFLSLPLQVRYGFGKHRWQLGAKAGVIANHVLGVSSEMPSLIPHHEAIHQRHTSIGTPSRADLQKWTLDYTFGLDLRYQLTNRFRLSLNGSYQQGMTPVYQSDIEKLPPCVELGCRAAFPNLVNHLIASPF